jgi:hypothetical protein
MITSDPIASHVSTLARALHGPRRTRRCMIAEVRSGLLDAAEAHQDAGLPPEQAATRAVREFGTVREIAPSLQDELTARQGRRAALVFALVFPAMILTWDLLWSSGLVRREPDTVGELVVTLAGLQDKAAVVIAVAAFALLAATFLRSVPPRLVTRAIGVTGTAGALVCGGISVMMGVAGGPVTATLLTTNAAAVLAYAGSGGVLTLIVWHAVRTLRVAQR